MAPIPRPGPGDCSPYHKRYVDLVPAGDIVRVLEGQIGETRRLLHALPPERELHRYEPGKWSVREVIGHLIDTERVFVYRALRFARRDETPLPGFEQDDFVRFGGFDRRTLRDLLDEFGAVRNATVRFFEGLNEESLGRVGVAADVSIRVFAFPYIIAGHELHHRAVLRERYLQPRAQPGGQARARPPSR